MKESDNMTNAEKIIKIANENNGYVTTKQVKDANINTIELTRLVEQNKYGDYVMGFETTSLYGKSSMYNRIRFFKYLGLTEGLSAIYISDDDWKALWNEYKSVYPNTKTNRLAPVKFQIVDKMARYYKKIGKEFPYEYKNVAFKRGVYFGYYVDNTLAEQIETWRNRWLKGRIERLNK